MRYSEGFGDVFDRSAGNSAICLCGCGDLSSRGSVQESRRLKSVFENWNLAPLLVQLFFVFPCASAPPNVVLIVADDLGYGDLACYGSNTNLTPHIDSLVRNGVRFTDFHSSGPMCTPTRVSILTGLYQQRFGPTFDNPLAGDTQRAVGLPHAAVTIAELLREHGSATSCFGKWHLGFQPPFLPTNQGFDEFRGLAAGDGDHHSHIDRYGNEDWWHNNEVEMESGYTADL